MKNKYLIAIAAIVMLMGLLFSNDKKSKVVQQKTADAETYKVPVKVVATAPSQSLSASAEAMSVAAPPISAETRQVNELVLKQFSLHLKLMNKCLGLTGDSVIRESTEPSFQNLLENLRPSLGDVVVQMDDWDQTEILDSDSTRKRIRVDYEYPDGRNPSRRLSMYQINSYGMPEIVNLTADEVNNPNEAYVASLIDGHKIVTEEKGARAYFPDGEELIFSERNGHLQSVSINKGDSSFNCFNLDEENSTCSCP